MYRFVQGSCSTMRLQTLLSCAMIWSADSLMPLKASRRVLSARTQQLWSQQADEVFPSPTSDKMLTLTDRKVLAAVASCGALETAYINANKLGLFALPESICSGAAISCSEVLNGPWSEVFGIPLTVPGMLAYLAVVGLSLAPLVTTAASNKDIESITQSMLLALTTMMLVFSGYLLSLLAFKIGAGCPWCFFSAAVSIFLSSFTWVRTGGVMPNLKVGLSSGSAALLASAVVYILCGTEVAIAEARTILEQPAIVAMSPPEITNKSGPREMKIAKALKERGAKMYGAYWCSHCFEQKQRLGAEAMRLIPYIECAKDGENSQTGLCKANKVCVGVCPISQKFGLTSSAMLFLIGPRLSDLGG